jgi:hypothetical protein
MNIITITRPDLSTEEKERRMEKIKQAAMRLVLETEKAKVKKNRNT